MSSGWQHFTTVWLLSSQTLASDPPVVNFSCFEFCNIVCNITEENKNPFCAIRALLISFASYISDQLQILLRKKFVLSFSNFVYTEGRWWLMTLLAGCGSVSLLLAQGPALSDLRDLIMLPIRSLLGLFMADELVRAPTGTVNWVQAGLTFVTSGQV